MCWRAHPGERGQQERKGVPEMMTLLGMPLTSFMVAAAIMFGAAFIGHIFGELRTKHNGLQVIGGIVLFIIVVWAARVFLYR